MHPVYRIDVARKLVTLYWEEFPTMARVREVVEEAIADPEFHPGMNFLWDRKPADANTATIDYLREAVYYLQVMAEEIGPHAWAVVTHNPADYGKGRIPGLRKLEIRSISQFWPTRFFPKLWCRSSLISWNPLRS